MPIARPKPCLHPGCAKLVPSGYCEAHAPAKQQWAKEKDRDRGSAAHRGYGRRWQKARATFLLRNPLCALCSTDERPVEATLVDHIIRHGLGDALDSGDALAIHAAQQLFWDSACNWQSLCTTCHNIKTVREDGGFGNDPLRRTPVPVTSAS